MINHAIVRIVTTTPKHTIIRIVTTTPVGANSFANRGPKS